MNRISSIISHNPFHFLYLMYLILLFPSNSFSQEYTISYTVQDICSCDIDLDRDQDLIICSANDGTTPDTLYIFYNDGIGNLTKTSLCRTNRIYAICGKLDNDAFPDIVTGAPDSLVYIKNNGDGTFGKEIGIAPSQGYRRIEYIIDMDRDTLNDLVYTYTSFYSKWGILKNESDLLFTDHIVYDDGMGTNLFPRIGNLNNDSLPDVCLEFTTEGIHVLMNNGDLTFDSLLLCSIKGYPAICSLDLTSPEDILVFSANTDELKLYENLGDNMFIDRNTLRLIDALSLNDIADFNNDGYADLCYSVCWFTNCTDSIYISIHDQNWSFMETQRYYVGPMEFFSTETADLNGDGFNDIIMYGYSPRNTFKILWNDGFGSFSYENPVGIQENYYQQNKINIEINPNPFTDRTRIYYDLFYESDIKINIYNNLGQIVETITEIGKPKGQHFNEFDASELENGIYFCTIISNGKPSGSVKMIVL
jgi:hypothetical protein